MNYEVEDCDENGVVRDGGKVRVKMSFMDHLMHDAIAHTHQRIVDSSLHRPGYRISRTYHDTADARASAYDSYDREITNAWRKVPYNAAVSAPDSGAGQNPGEYWSLPRS